MISKDIVIVTLVKDNHLDYFKTRMSIRNQTVDVLHFVFDSSLIVNKEITEPGNQNFFYFHSEPIGIYQTMNLAIRTLVNKLSVDPYILFLNSGDSLINESIIESLTLLNLKESWFYCDYLVEDPIAGVRKKVTPTRWSIRRQLYNKQPIHHQALFVRLSLLLKLSGFNPTYSCAADWDFIIRLSLLVPGRHVALTSTVFVLGGHSSQNREIGNHEIFALRKIYLGKWPFEAILSNFFLAKQGVRIYFYFKFLGRSPKVLKIFRLLTGWT